MKSQSPFFSDLFSCLAPFAAEARRNVGRERWILYIFTPASWAPLFDLLLKHAHRLYPYSEEQVP